MKLLGCLLLLITTFAISLAQTSPYHMFQISAPAKGNYAYVMQKASESREPIKMDSDKAEVIVPEDPNGVSIYLINLDTNRAAKTDMATVLKTDKWAPKAEAFTLIAQIDVTIQTAGGKLPAGNLKLESKNKNESVLITESSNNQAHFSFWPDASIKFTLDYEHKGEKKSTATTVDIPKGLSPHNVTIVIPEQFASTSPTTPVDQKGGERDPPKAPESKNPLQSFFQLLVGLVVVGALGYGAYWYYKNNQQVVEKLANQAGLNPQQNADPTGALPPEPVKRELQKIDLGSGAEPTAAAPMAAAAPAVKNPRLVTSDGDIFMIQEGNSTVGREGAALTLAGESSVSRVHATLERSGDSITLSDNGSTNGTYLNGIKIDSPRVLNPGDTVQFGAVQYRYEE
ncbi:MAG: FHA domain-containing protein [Fimbriimonadaceae bacterium]|nr:MAG: FHA domain-containing protein [Fimbriimonadaceae bacterium]